MQTETQAPRGSERRATDRRQTRCDPLPFADRRKDQRRSGTDRRATPEG